jgi:hypothetical protein
VPTHSVSLSQLPRQLVPLQTYGVHIIVCTLVHMPPAAHTVRLCKPALQVCATQTVPTATLHVLSPWQEPLWHVAMFALQTLWGSGLVSLAVTLEQMPFVPPGCPPRLQARQPEHMVGFSLQQRPSTQLLLEQRRQLLPAPQLVPPTVQAEPLPRRGVQVPLLQ